MRDEKLSMGIILPKQGYESETRYDFVISLIFNSAGVPACPPTPLRYGDAPQWRWQGIQQSDEDVA